MGSAASVDAHPRQLKDLKAVAKEHNIEWTDSIQAAFADAVKGTQVATIQQVLGKLPEKEKEQVMQAIQQAQTEAAAEKAQNESTDAGAGANAPTPGEGQSAEEKAAVKVQAVVRGRQARKQETAEEKQKRLEEERKAELFARKDGTITAHYNMYHEKFTIKDNSMKAFDIDDMYCLSDVMPGCIVRLSTIDNTCFKGERWELPFVQDDVNGIFQGLMDGEEYWVVVIENEEQLKRDQAATAKRMADLGAHNKFGKNQQHMFCRTASQKALMGDGSEPQVGVSRKEGCSCIYGNPCTDKYICNNWDNRYAVARKNGWKG